MRKHCYEQVDKLVQPIMDFMREEYPNDCKMVISADFAHIEHKTEFLIMPSNEYKSQRKQKQNQYNDIANKLQNIKKSIVETKEIQAEEMAVVLEALSIFLDQTK